MNLNLDKVNSKFSDKIIDNKELANKTEEKNNELELEESEDDEETKESFFTDEFYEKDNPNNKYKEFYKETLVFIMLILYEFGSKKIIKKYNAISDKGIDIEVTVYFVYNMMNIDNMKWPKSLKNRLIKFKTSRNKDKLMYKHIMDVIRLNKSVITIEELNIQIFLILFYLDKLKNNYYIPQLSKQEYFEKKFKFMNPKEYVKKLYICEEEILIYCNITKEDPNKFLIHPLEYYETLSSLMLNFTGWTDNIIDKHMNRYKHLFSSDKRIIQKVKNYYYRAIRRKVVPNTNPRGYIRFDDTDDDDDDEDNVNYRYRGKDCSKNKVNKNSNDNKNKNDKGKENSNKNKNSKNNAKNRSLNNPKIDMCLKTETLNDGLNEKIVKMNQEKELDSVKKQQNDDKNKKNNELMVCEDRNFNELIKPIVLKLNIANVFHNTFMFANNFQLKVISFYYYIFIPYCIIFILLSNMIIYKNYSKNFTQKQNFKEKNLDITKQNFKNNNLDIKDDDKEKQLTFSTTTFIPNLSQLFHISNLENDNKKIYEKNDNKKI